MPVSDYERSGEILVPTSTPLDQNQASVARLGSGAFVVTWIDEAGETGDGANSAVRGQLFDADGQKLGAEFLVNTTTADDQRASSVAALESGGFVVAWLHGFGSTKVQIFDAAGQKVGAEIVPPQQLDPSSGGVP